MLEQIEIFNYRSCLHTHFTLQPDLSVLIGPNSAGKTNVLRAILLLKKLTDETGFHSEIEDQVSQSILKATFLHSNKRAKLTAEINLITDENNLDDIIGAKQKWYARDFTGSSKRIDAPIILGAAFSDKKAPPSIRNLEFARAWHAYRRFRYPISPQHLEKVPVPLRQALGRIYNFSEDIKYYGASRFTNPSACPVSFEVEKEGQYRRLLSYDRYAQFLYDLYISKTSAGSGFRQFFNIVGPQGIGLVQRIDFEEITISSVEHKVRSGGRVRLKTAEKNLIIPQLFIGKNQLSPNQLSEGTFKTLTLLFYLITERSSALLIEEPEVCVHQGLLSSIIELIKIYSKRKQIVVSTHSDFVLDQVAPRNVYRVSRDKKQGTIVNSIQKTMSRKEFSALKTYLDTEGNLGEYWRHGGLD